MAVLRGLWCGAGARRPSAGVASLLGRLAASLLSRRASRVQCKAVKHGRHTVVGAQLTEGTATQAAARAPMAVVNRACPTLVRLRRSTDPLLNEAGTKRCAAGAASQAGAMLKSRIYNAKALRCAPAVAAARCRCYCELLLPQPITKCATSRPAGRGAGSPQAQTALSHRTAAAVAGGLPSALADPLLLPEVTPHARSSARSSEQLRMVPA